MVQAAFCLFGPALLLPKLRHFQTTLTVTAPVMA